MADDRQIGEDELLDVADNPEQARSLHRALRTISASPSLEGPVRDMARHVLRGDMGMKDAIETERYREAVLSRIHEIRTAAENQTFAERQANKERFARWQEQQQAEEAREQAERDAPTQLHSSLRNKRGGGPSHRL
jgi:hypothetical protein